MSRILKRPMFRKGGEVMEGIMTGIKPRQNYNLAGRVEDYQNVLRSSMGQPVGGDPLARFLIETGQGLVGGAGADRGSKLAEILGATEKPTQNLFAALDKKAASDRSINLQGAILGIKGQQAIDAAKAKGSDKFQKEFKPEDFRDRLLMKYAARKPGYQKELVDIYSYEMATFDAIDRDEIKQVPAFKGKNLKVMDNKIVGSKATFTTDDLIAGTLYFRPDQSELLYERDPEKNAIVIYNKKTGDILKEISLGG
jgi:hypothetical protein